MSDATLTDDEWGDIVCNIAGDYDQHLRPAVERIVAARAAAAERGALERAREAIKAERLSISKQVQVVMGLVRAERIVRDLMPRKDGE